MLLCNERRLSKKEVVLMFAWKKTSQSNLYQWTFGYCGCHIIRTVSTSRDKCVRRGSFIYIALFILQVVCVRVCVISTTTVARKGGKKMWANQCSCLAALMLLDYAWSRRLTLTRDPLAVYSTKVVTNMVTWPHSDMPCRKCEVHQKTFPMLAMHLRGPKGYLSSQG